MYDSNWIFSVSRPLVVKEVEKVRQLSTVPEHKLIKKLYLKDEAAFSYLYDRYSSNLYSTIFEIVKNKEHSEDVLQEVFVRIWKNFEQYDAAKGKLYTWMQSLTRNLALDFLRSKQQRKSVQTISLDNILLPQDYHCEFLKFEGLYVKKWLLKLEQRYADIIRMAYFEGMTQQEIADEFKIPVGTVKTRMRLGILQLQKLLEEKTVVVDIKTISKAPTLAIHSINKIASAS